MKRKPTRHRLTSSQVDLSVAFYDAEVDHSRESFEMIARRVVPNGFGKKEDQTRTVFKKEARRMFYFAR